MNNSYIRQLNFLIDVSADAVINIINGEVSYLSSEKLDMNERIKLFKFFLIKSDIRRQQNKKVLKNITKILSCILISDKYRLHIFRSYDLENHEKNILIKLTSFVTISDFKDKEEFQEFLKVVQCIQDNDVIPLKDKKIHNNRRNDIAI